MAAPRERPADPGKFSHKSVRAHPALSEFCAGLNKATIFNNSPRPEVRSCTHEHVLTKPTGRLDFCVWRNMRVATDPNSWLNFIDTDAINRHGGGHPAAQPGEPVQVTVEQRLIRCSREMVQHDDRLAG